MDGNAAAFLFAPPDYASLAKPGTGVLYIDDFDAELHDDARQDAASDPANLIVTLADIADAREEGRLAGLQEALDDAHLLQSQIQAAATQSLADALTSAQAVLTKMAVEVAQDAVKVVLAMLRACVPSLMERHAEGETEALLRALLPSILVEPELCLRSHPDAADGIRDLVANLLPHGTATVRVTADEMLAPSDVQIAWRDGGATRDTKHVWTAICAALAPLNLPPVEELCRGFGS